MSPRPVTPLAILVEVLASVRDRLDDGQVDAALRDDVRRAAALAAGLDAYPARMSTPESAGLRALARRTDAEDWSSHGGGTVLEREMLSGHLEGQLLKTLVHATGARRVLEIGMFTGYSALAMAEALPADGRLVACEIDAAVAALARECFDAAPGGERIDVRVGPALDTLASLAEVGETFDLVFVDADKAGYVDYVRTLLDRGLLAPGALVCVDNTLMQGQPWLEGERTPVGAAIADFNEVVADDPRVEQVVLPVRDGLTLIRQVPERSR